MSKIKIEFGKIESPNFEIEKLIDLKWGCLVKIFNSESYTEIFELEKKIDEINSKIWEAERRRR